MSAEQATIEVAEEVVEKTVPLAFRLMRNRGVQVGAVAVISAAVASELTYLWTKKRISDAVWDEAGKQVEAAKEYYASMRVVQEPKRSPEEILQELHGGDTEAAEAHAAYLGKRQPEVVEAEDGTIMTSEVQETVLVDDTDAETQAALQEDVTGRNRPVHQNIFSGKNPSEDEWDYEFETRIREENPGEPYILHHDEFFENDPDHEQAQLTYYEGDDTLADDKDVPVPDPDATVGTEALTQFGHGSKDRNTVYVRNERLDMDFEIVKSNGKYSVEVLGLDDTDSLQHSYSRPRRFRESDD